MKAQNSKITGIAALALAGVLSFSVLPLTGCGGSSSSSSSASNTTNSQAANNTSDSSSSSNDNAADNSNAAEETTNSNESNASENSNASSSDVTLDSVESMVTSAYMGTNEDTGEGYYLAMNDDGSLGMLAVLNTNSGADNATSASFVGHGTVTGNNYTITDYVTGDQIGFDVTDNGDGTYTLDLGDQYGKATVQQVQVSDVVNAFKTIDKYTTSVN